MITGETMEPDGSKGILIGLDFTALRAVLERGQVAHLKDDSTGVKVTLLFGPTEDDLVEFVKAHAKEVIGP